MPADPAVAAIQAALTGQGQGQGWRRLRQRFAWPDMAGANLARHCVGARAGDGSLALIDGTRHWTHGALDAAAARLGSVFAAQGAQRGDRVAILLGQGAACLVAHLACYRAGLIAVPLFARFGAEALSVRLGDAGARVLVTDPAGLDAVRALDIVQPAALVEGGGAGALDLWEAIAAAQPAPSVATGPEDPALLIYTSGTTGAPKGALHGHRVLLAHLPGVITHHDLMPHRGDRLWTPADWAWMGGLMNVALPALALGVPLVANPPGRFDPEATARLVAGQGIRNAFLPPTALKMLRAANVRMPGLRSAGSGGEALGPDLLAWGEDAFGLTINEFYGQTEANLIVGNCAALVPPIPGSAGRAVPGHEVAVIDMSGAPVPDGTAGEIAVRAPGPGLFLRYWNAPEKTAAKFAGPWLRTGDEGSVQDGDFRFHARSDDVINASGYRVGPTEIEACLVAHPAVAMAAAVGVPDPIRGEAIRAVIVLRSGPEAGLDEALRAHVRTRLGPHLTPREVFFVQELPLTATGKILRRALKGTLPRPL